MTKLAVVTFNEVPDSPLTFKYDVLGELSLRNHRQYCEAHGYTFISESPIDRSRPVCWSKLSAVYEALQTHEWVLWADSDTLIFDMAARLEDFCDSRYDLVVQEQEHWWKLIGLEKGTERFPINSGVFLIKSSPWSLKFLAASYAETRFVTNGTCLGRCRRPGGNECRHSRKPGLPPTDQVRSRAADLAETVPRGRLYGALLRKSRTAPDTARGFRGSARPVESVTRSWIATERHGQVSLVLYSKQKRVDISCARRPAQLSLHARRDSTIGQVVVRSDRPGESRFSTLSRDCKGAVRPRTTTTSHLGWTFLIERTAAPRAGRLAGLKSRVKTSKGAQ